jgi:hypothetical protein
MNIPSRVFVAAFAALAALWAVTVNRVCVMSSTSSQPPEVLPTRARGENLVLRTLGCTFGSGKHLKAIVLSEVCQANQGSLS